MAWRKSSYSFSNSNCVEVDDQAPGAVSVRDSKLGEASPVLNFTTEQWREHVEALKAEARTRVSLGRPRRRGLFVE